MMRVTLSRSSIAFARQMALACGVALCASAGMAGCGGNGNNNVDSGPGVTDAAPTVDGAGGQAVTIKFAAMVGSKPANCTDTYDGIGTKSTPIIIKDMRLYVSNVQLLDSQNNPVPVTLDQNNWQYKNVALLDFEDGTGGCADTGTTETNMVVTGHVPTGTYNGLEFDVGVPYKLDHLDVSTAPAPLDVPAMFWAWSKGYKFTRINVLAGGGGMDAGAGLPYQMHLGSTMCDSTGPTPPSSECAHPNRPTITLSAFDPSADTVAFDIGALFANNDLTTDTAMSPPGCHCGSADAAECTPMFPTLGLDFSTGKCTNNCSGQTVFKIMQ